MRHPQLLSNLFQCLATIIKQRIFSLICNLNLLFSQLKTLSVIPSLGVLAKISSPSLYATLTYWEAATKSPWSLPFSRLNPSSLSLFLKRSSRHKSSSSEHFCGPLKQVYAFLVLQVPELEATLKAGTYNGNVYNVYVWWPC